MRRWLGLICLFIIFFQGVPMKGMCKLLAKQKTSVVTDINAGADADEDNDDEDDAAVQASPFDADIILPDHSLHILSGKLYFQYKQVPILSRADTLPLMYSVEVTVPPPDKA